MFAEIAPATALHLADAILVLHFGIVAFVVFGEATILFGGWRRWEWVRRFWLRVFHLVLIGFIALQAWLGELCPLTVWEQALRETGGEGGYQESFIEHWLSRLVYVEAPWWVFVAAYTAFVALVLATWFWVPPRRNADADR